MKSAVTKRLGALIEHRIAMPVLSLLILLLATATRFINLASPKTLVFDETYYVKDAYTLGKFGYEKQWPEDANLSFEAGDLDVYLDAGSYVVHPPFGKWLIWLGLEMFGADNGLGWRFATALAGVISVGLVILIARRLTGSHLFGNLAGLLLALEGTSIVLSRTAILDGLLTVMVLMGLYLLLIADGAMLKRANRLGRLGIWVQPWLLAVGVVMGLAASVKWSALYVLAGFGLYTFFSELKARSNLGQSPLGAFGQGFINAITLLVPALAAYIASWFGWITSDGGWGRNDKATWWEALWAYHQNAYSFHTGLSSEHPYQANAFEWLLSLRPTAFFFERYYEDPICGPLGDCTVAITTIPNLVVWFGGLLAIIWLIRRALLGERAAMLVILGFLATWGPWVIYLNRTVFQFYAVLITPFVVLALVLAAHHYWRRGIWLRQLETRERRIRLLVIAAVVVAGYFMSIWMGLPVPHWVWRIQMLLPIWV